MPEPSLDAQACAHAHQLWTRVRALHHRIQRTGRRARRCGAARVPGRGTHAVTRSSTRPALRQRLEHGLLLLEAQFLVCSHTPGAARAARECESCAPGLRR
jgi:hypothetical protein